MSTKTVLEWLRDVLAYVAKDPDNRLDEALKKIKEHKEEVVRAVEEAIEPELREYAEWFIAAITGEIEEEDKGMEAAPEGKEAGLPKGSHGEDKGTSREGQDQGMGNVQSVAEQRGRSDSVSVDVETSVQEGDGGDSLLLLKDNRQAPEEPGEEHPEKD